MGFLYTDCPHSDVGSLELVCSAGHTRTPVVSASFDPMCPRFTAFQNSSLPSLSLKFFSFLLLLSFVLSFSVIITCHVTLLFQLFFYVSQESFEFSSHKYHIFLFKIISRIFL